MNKLIKLKPNLTAELSDDFHFVNTHDHDETGIVDRVT